MKKGKTDFTYSDADSICDLLRKLREADPKKQKRLRRELRKDYGFHIRDFSNSSAGFREENFRELVTGGTITLHP
ncbi:hypothetical protein OKW40_002482 [Paraburkholderia sp. RAU6.4a]|uniref:hypothetical protein n=1 Tax=Paraburkholderia sp. RAU6.4a TaxID=2991067 RepID=UPI003D1F68AF